MSFCLRPNVCKKCGKPLTLFEGWTCLECDKAEQESSGETIYKQVALDAIENEYKGKANEVLAHEIVNIMAIIDDIPPVNPIKIGYWIKENSVLRCSECNERVARYDNYAYCPYCGAKMVEPQESEG